jgi:hypothetical protein
MQVLFSWHYNLVRNLQEKQVLTRNRIWCLVLLLWKLSMARHSPVLNHIRLLRLLALPIRQRNVESEDISFSVAFIGVPLPPGLVRRVERVGVRNPWAAASTDIRRGALVLKPVRRPKWIRIDLKKKRLVSDGSGDRPVQNWSARSWWDLPNGGAVWVGSRSRSRIPTQLGLF